MNRKRVAVVTGGSSGIGFAIAKKMVENDIDVTILGRTESSLKMAETKLGGKIHWLRADVGNREEVEAAVRSILRRTGSIDILINNAGTNEILTTQVPLQEGEAAWDQVIDTNLKGAFLMTVAIAPHLRRSNGRIINISSIGAYTGGSSAGGLAYASSKSGLLGLTFALARELSGDGITVNAIAPGLIAQTNFFKSGLDEDRLNRITAQIPVGRAGTPEDIAAAVWFLVSPEASYITGEVININGGWLFG